VTATVLSSIARSVVAYAERHGFARPRLLAELGVDDAVLSDVDARLPYGRYLALWAHLDAHTTDPFFGLHFAESQVDAETFSAVGWAARSCATLGEGVALFARASDLVDDAERIDVRTDVRTDVREGDVAVLGQNARDPRTRWPRHKTEGALANFAVLGRRWTGVEFRVRRVRLQHARPADVSELARVFGEAELVFEAPVNELEIDAAALDLPLRHAEPALRDWLGRRIDAQLRERASSASSPRPAAPRASGPRTSEDVAHAIEPRLANGAPTIGEVAKALGMSARTLQRRLDDEGTTFAAVLDEIRRTRALEAIADRRVSVDELTVLLGFADPKSFRRAFQRWTGTSPRAFRRGQAA
jgi:AraC-like DNA-binding protein